MNGGNKFFKLGIALAAIGIMLVVFSVTAYYLLLPDVGVLAVENPRTTAYIQRYIYRTRAKGKKPVVLMRWVQLAEVSPDLRHAVLIAEDDNFYQHAGVDWDAIQKAIAYNRKKGRLLRGASTITQQVARNLYLSPERSVLRKLKEIAIAIKLERVLTKDRILEIYLNIAEWGKGIYGAQAASEIYFGKKAADLTPEEAASLAAALPSPWSRNPSRADQKSPLERKKGIILQRMVRAGYLLPGESEGEIEVPGVPENSPSAKPSSAEEIKNGDRFAPCDTSSTANSKIKLGAPSDSCGPKGPSFFGR